MLLFSLSTKQSEATYSLAPASLYVTTPDINGDNHSPGGQKCSPVMVTSVLEFVGRIFPPVRTETCLRVGVL